jgi:hypothetical protein
MAIQIKSLNNGEAPVKDTSIAAMTDNFNKILTANEVYDLYSAPSTPGGRKSAIVKSIRVVNTHTSTVTVNLYFCRPNSSGQNRRRQLSPVDLALGAGQVYIEDDEITLEPGDKIQGKANIADKIHFLISGVERDDI